MSRQKKITVFDEIENYGGNELSQLHERAKTVFDDIFERSNRAIEELVTEAILENQYDSGDNQLVHRDAKGMLSRVDVVIGGSVFGRVEVRYTDDHKVIVSKTRVMP